MQDAPEPGNYKLIKILETDPTSVKDFAQIAELRGYPPAWARAAFEARKINNTREEQLRFDRNNTLWHERWAEKCNERPTLPN